MPNRAASSSPATPAATEQSTWAVMRVRRGAHARVAAPPRRCRRPRTCGSRGGCARSITNAGRRRRRSMTSVDTGHDADAGEAELLERARHLAGRALVLGVEVALDDQADAERGDERVHLAAGDDQAVARARSRPTTGEDRDDAQPHPPTRRPTMVVAAIRLAQRHRRSRPTGRATGTGSPASGRWRRSPSRLDPGEHVDRCWPWRTGCRRRMATRTAPMTSDARPGQTTSQVGRAEAIGGRCRTCSRRRRPRGHAVTASTVAGGQRHDVSSLACRRAARRRCGRRAARRCGRPCR